MVVPLYRCLILALLVLCLNEVEGDFSSAFKFLKKQLLNNPKLQLHRQARETYDSTLAINKQELEQHVIAKRGISAADSSSVLLARQLMLQQLFLEERIRSDGFSGIKQTRIKESGSKIYDVNTGTGSRVASIHDHANNIRTVGMGELIVVLNGVEFRTRHNDYRLYMPSTENTNYKEVEEIPFPPVPKAVLQQASVEQEIIEMREWFRAWKEQNYTVRDYRPYFKPVLCYLEGTWTHASDNIEESFDSDRHFLDASSWFDLHEKIRYTSYSGRKSQLENYAFLPSTIMNMAADGTPELAQWNYRILCHPLKDDLPTENFRLVDDLAARANHGRTMNNHLKSRAARFQLDPRGEKWTRGEHDGVYNYLDELMMEVPGMDNYPADLEDNIIGSKTMHYDGSSLNAGYYHNVYRMSSKDAMGESVARRSISDATVYFAMNNQSRVASPNVEFCKKKKKLCYTSTQKWSYAIPLEIIYLTPLSNWNPYNLEYKGDAKSPLGQTVTDGRTGSNSLDSAYNGTNSKVYYRTPSEFFKSASASEDKADTARGEAAVLGPDGRKFFLVQASGTRIALPEIDGVGALRTRYPIMPMHHEGNPIMKELEALKDLVAAPSQYGHLLRESKVTADVGDVTFRLSNSKREPRHTHRVIVSRDDSLYMMQNGGTAAAVTDAINGHDHGVVIKYDQSRNKFYLHSCDGILAPEGKKGRCRDGHSGWLTIEQEEQ